MYAIGTICSPVVVEISMAKLVQYHLFSINLRVYNRYIPSRYFQTWITKYWNIEILHKFFPLKKTGGLLNEMG